MLFTCDRLQADLFTLAKCKVSASRFFFIFYPHSNRLFSNSLNRSLQRLCCVSILFHSYQPLASCRFVLFAIHFVSKAVGRLRNDALSLQLCYAIQYNTCINSFTLLEACRAWCFTLVLDRLKLLGWKSSANGFENIPAISILDR